MPPCGKGRRTFGHCCEVKMRSIREYIRKTLFDSSSILSAYRLDAPQRVKDFAFVRAPVERLADGEDVFFLSFAVDGRTMPVDTVHCTMWDLL